MHLSVKNQIQIVKNASLSSSHYKASHNLLFVCLPFISLSVSVVHSTNPSLMRAVYTVFLLLSEVVPILTSTVIEYIPAIRPQELIVQLCGHVDEARVPPAD